MFFEDFFRTQGETEGHSGQELDQFIQEAIDTLEASRTAQYRALHDQYGRFNTDGMPSRVAEGDVVDLDMFDDTYDGVLLQSEEDTIRAGIKVWTEDELLFTINAGLLKAVSDTQVNIEDPNIVGHHVTLLVSGSVGQAEGQTLIDLSTTPVQLTPEERVALAAAERIDVVYLGNRPVTTVVDFVSNGLDPSTIIRTDVGSWLADGFEVGMVIQVQGNTANETEDQEVYEVIHVTASTLSLGPNDALSPETGVEVSVASVILDPTEEGVVVSAIQINEREDIDVDALGLISITAGQEVFLGSEFDLRIATVEAGDAFEGGNVRIKGGQGIINGATEGAAAVRSGDLILEAAEGSIGSESAVFVTDLIGEGTITARADGGVYLAELTGDMNVETIFSRMEGAFLVADGSIIDALNHDFTNIQAPVVVLTAGGGIGETGDRLDVDVVGSGLLTATAEGSIGLNETFGSMNIRNILSRTGDVDLKAQLSILDAIDIEDPTNPDSADVDVVLGGESKPNTDVIGNNIALTAVLGTIGEVGNDLDVDTSYSNPGGLSAITDNGNIFIIERPTTSTEGVGNLFLNTVGTSGNTSAFITALTGGIFQWKSRSRWCECRFRENLFDSQG